MYFRESSEPLTEPKLFSIRQSESLSYPFRIILWSSFRSILVPDTGWNTPEINRGERTAPHFTTPGSLFVLESAPRPLTNAGPRHHRNWVVYHSIHRPGGGTSAVLFFFLTGTTTHYLSLSLMKYQSLTHLRCLQRRRFTSAAKD